MHKLKVCIMRSILKLNFNDWIKFASFRPFFQLFIKNKYCQYHLLHFFLTKTLRTAIVISSGLRFQSSLRFSLLTLSL
jgi:hypothetical protein